MKASNMISRAGWVFSAGALGLVLAATAQALTTAF
jgi:hypothetical protein